MGLSNSPGTFQRLIDMVLRGLRWSSVLVYIDDIIVYAHSHADLKLAEVFQRLQAANLKLKHSKVRLFRHEIKFLGHRVSAQGVVMDESQVTEIIQWPALINIHDTPESPLSTS